MSWDYDKEPRRPAGPSKAELERQLQDALRNTGGVDAKPRKIVPKPDPLPEPYRPKLRSDPPPPFVPKLRNEPPAFKPRIRNEPEPARVTWEPVPDKPDFICERCGGPRSQYSSAVCRACYQNQRREGPELPRELREAVCLDFRFVRNIRLVRTLEFALSQLDAPDKSG